MAGPEVPAARRDDEEAGRRPSKRRRVNPIEVANKKSNEDFIAEYIRPSPGWTEWTHPGTGTLHRLSLHRAPQLSAADLRGCFRLVEETSAEDYRHSSMGWRPAEKQREMRSADLRYVVVREAGGSLVRAFTSMMPTYEGGEAVVYCYEVHVSPELQGTGLGARLMALVTATAQNIPGVRKTMLTCFVSNPRGRRFYERLGFDTDATSPRTRALRGGREAAPDYVILSRPADDDGHDGNDHGGG